MNPRHRRLLIPGLLVALIVVVVVSSLLGRAEGAEATQAPSEPVSTIDDPRITEASGLAISVEHGDLGYVINDSGNEPLVFAVRISTGEVVGTARAEGVTWSDTEALAIDPDGTLWVADTGDNLVRRDDAALYSFAEPGPGDHTVRPERFAVGYPDGPEDVEALLRDPTSGATYLISKGLVVGDVYALPNPLRTDGTNVAERVGKRVSGIVTDAAFSSDGSRVLVRTYADVRELDPADWSLQQRIAVPAMQQGETLAFERGDASFLIGSEGEGSPLVRVALADRVPTATPSPTPTRVTTDGQPAPSGNGFAGRSWLLAFVAIAGLVGVSAWTARRR